MEKIREVVERLVKHEHEALEVRADAAAAVARSEALIERLDPPLFNFSSAYLLLRLAEVKKTLAQREKEIEELMNVRDAYGSPPFGHQSC